jgi:hypothetical protein
VRGVFVVVVVAVGVVVWHVIGWVWSEDTAQAGPPAPPTSQQLADIRADADPPVFWLGEIYRGDRISDASHDPPRLIAISYGDPYRGSSDSWLYPIDVATLRDRQPITDGKICWRRLGEAWLLGCPGYEEVEIFTDDVLIYVTATSPHDVVPSLQRLDGSHGSKKNLAPPQPFACSEIEAFPTRFRRKLPAALQSDCG